VETPILRSVSFHALPVARNPISPEVSANNRLMPGTADFFALKSNSETFFEELSLNKNF